LADEAVLALNTPIIAVLGAGAGGIAVGVRLLQAGIESFTIYEATEGVGGTWRRNTYPGAACDVMSHLYSFSFAPNPSWTRTFAGQAEILAYLESVTDDFGLRPHVRFGVRMVSAAWQDDASRWLLTTADGEQIDADVVVSALGLFSEPRLPDLDGLGRFEGPKLHTARWDHDVELSGRRVAVVGTGASAVQLVPQLAAQAASLEVFQRHPAWMLPKPERDYTEQEMRRFRLQPWTARQHREQIWRELHENTVVRLDDERTGQRQLMAQAYLHHKVTDPTLREALTPDYPFGCRRVLLGGSYFAALQLAHVALRTSPIVEVEPTGIRTRDGQLHACDALVFATGFETTKYLGGFEVVGRQGRRLHEEWEPAAQAYLGVAVAGYPNFFMLYGPNTNQGGNSIIAVLEAGAAFVLDAVRHLAADPRALDVRPEAQASFNAELQAELAGTVWNACDSYFRTGNGQIVTQWPWTSLDYERRTAKIDHADFSRLARRGSD
jgi:cation diffusion facilitator CzcD-associated flavoprotein CzcO